MPFKIQVKYNPPVKGGQHPDEKNRKEMLRNEAKKQLGYNVPKPNLVILSVKHYNSTSAADALNVLGGIADVLSDIAYEDDSQIVESHYKKIWDKKDWYIVELNFLKSTRHMITTKPIEEGNSFPAFFE